MKGDSGLARLVAGVHGVSVFQEWVRERSHVGPFPADVFDITAARKTPGVCVGCFHITRKEEDSSVFTEEFVLPDDKAFIVDRVGVLGSGDLLLSAGFSGGTFPSPSLCNFRVWATNLLGVTGCLEELLPTPTNSFDSLYFVAKQPIVSDRLVIQGTYTVLTVCLLGRPVNISLDIRWVTGKRFHSSRLSHSLCRAPFSETIPDPCPHDSTLIACCLSTTDAGSPPAPLPTENPPNLAGASHPFVTDVSTYLNLLEQSELHNLLAKELPDDTCYPDKDCLPIPPVEVLQNIAILAVDYLQEFHVLLSSLIPTWDAGKKDLRSALQYNLFTSPLWRRLLSLAFWPLDVNSTYSRYHTFMSCPELCFVKNQVQPGNTQHTVKFTPLDVFDGSTIKKKICLRLLCSMLKISPVVADILCFFYGHWALFSLGNFDDEPPRFPTQWPYPLIKMKDRHPSQFQVHPLSIKVVALECLCTLSNHCLGVMSLTYPSPYVCEPPCLGISTEQETSTSGSLYNLLVKSTMMNPGFLRPWKKKLVKLLLNNVLVFESTKSFSIAMEYLRESKECGRISRRHVFFVVETLSLLTLLFQWDASRPEDRSELWKWPPAGVADRAEAQGWSIGLMYCEAAVQKLLRLVQPTLLYKDFLDLYSVLMELQQASRFTANASVLDSGTPSCESFQHHLHRTHRHLGSFLSGNAWFENLELQSDKTLINAGFSLCEELLKWLLSTSTGARALLCYCGCSSCERCLWTAPTGSKCEAQCIINQFSDPLARQLNQYKMVFSLLTNILSLGTPSSVSGPASVSFFPLSIFSCSIQRQAKQVEWPNENFSLLLSFENVFKLSLCLRSSSNVDVFLRICGNSVTVPAFICQMLLNILTRQQAIEAAQKKLDGSATAAVDETHTTLPETLSDLVSLSAIGHLVNIMWKIWMHRDSYHELRLLTELGYDAIVLLCDALCATDPQSNDTLSNFSTGLPTDSSSLANKMLQLLSKTPTTQFTWGEIDLSFQAYGNLHSFSDDTKNDVNMLKYLVPASIFTSLKQMLQHDVWLVRQLYDLYTGMQVVRRCEISSHLTKEATSTTQTEKVGMDSRDSTNLLESLDTPSASALYCSAEPHNDTFLHSDAHRHVELLISCFISLSSSIFPNHIVTLTESTHVGAPSTVGSSRYAASNAAQLTRQSITAVKLGGYKGTWGIPVIEPQCTSSAETKSTTFTCNDKAPPCTLSWKSQAYTAIRLLLNVLRVHTPESATDHLSSTMYGGEERLAVLNSTCFQAPHLLVQKEFSELCAACISVLNACAACICPSFFWGQGGKFVYSLQGQEADAWFHTAKDTLPLTIITLEFVYRLIYICLPPLLPDTQSQLFLGTLIDFNLENTLILLMSRLLYAFVLTSRSGPDDQDATTSRESPMHHPSETATQWADDLKLCLDILTSIIRMICARCPDTSAFFLENVLRQSRLLPANFALAPFTVSSLLGLGLCLPENEAAFHWSNHVHPLMALELNGAEGRNLEAVVMRIKQLYLQRHHKVNQQDNLTAEHPTASLVTSRLPPSMTTLCLSTAIHFPEYIQQYLQADDSQLFLVVKIPLVQPVTTHKSNDNKRRFHRFYNSSIAQRRLGRLSMGHENDILSFSVFYPGSQLLPQRIDTPEPQDQANTLVEWTVWDRVSELLHNSLGEEAVEIALESKYAPAVPLGLSASHVERATDSSSCVKEMLKRLNNEELAVEKAKLERLSNMSRRYKQLTIENLGEFVELLLMSCHTSNHLLHATTANALATLVWSNGPPLLDLVLHTAQSITVDLYAYLVREFKEKKYASVSRLFLLARLVLLIDHTFCFFPEPTVEEILCLIQLAVIGLQALQDVPVLEAGCPKYLVLTGIFDCLLPAFIRILRRATGTFDILLHEFMSREAIRRAQSSSEPRGDGETSEAVDNLVPHPRPDRLIDQFRLTLQKRTVSSSASGPTAAYSSRVAIGHPQPTVASSSTAALPLTAPGSTTPSGTSNTTTTTPMSSTPGASSITVADVLSHMTYDVQMSLRLCCSGLSSIVNQLPVTWDISKRQPLAIDPLVPSDTEWSGLSLSVITDILDAFENISSNRLLTAVSLMKLDDHVLDQFLLQLNTQNSVSSLSNLRLTGTPSPTIKLDGLLIGLTDFLSYTPEPINMAVLGIIHQFVRICKNIIVFSGITSLPLLLAVALPDTVLESLSSVYPTADTNDTQATTKPIDCNTNDHFVTSGSCTDFLKKEFLGTLRETLCILSGQLHTKHSSTGGVLDQRAELLTVILNDIDHLRHYVVNQIGRDSQQPVLHLSDCLPSAEPASKHPCNITFFYATPVTMSLPLHFPFLATSSPYLHDPPSTMILNLAMAMKHDALWTLSATLDKVVAQYNIDSQVEQSSSPYTTSFQCLSLAVWSQAADHMLPKTSGSSMHLHNVLLPSIPQSQQSIPRPSPVTSTATDTFPADPFRARRGPSSRAPSKHVDEFEAQQAKQDLTTKPKPSFASGDPSLDASLEAIPEWKDFVTSGKEHGLDVMRILQTPQLLQEPALESRFRFLVELHPSIKTLFSMMELDMAPS